MEETIKFRDFILNCVFMELNDKPPKLVEKYLNEILEKFILK